MISHPKVYSFYITTNANRTVLYCGMTNNLIQRLTEHFLMRGNSFTFAGKHYCYWLIYYEHFRNVHEAVSREKEVKKWRREKKEALINIINPEWRFLNYELFDVWPAGNQHHRGAEWCLE